MSRSAKAPFNPIRIVREIALRLPEVEEGTSCNKVAFKSGGKAFLFFGSDASSYNVMVKLCDSLPEAAALAAKAAGNYKVGGHNWVTARFGFGETPPAGLLERWIEESYRLLVPKRILAKLPECGPVTTPRLNRAHRAKPSQPKRKSR
jgi:hypothetical protein